MMKTANVVIGANYGDEGKGLFTDYLVSPYGSDALVVRFNGGAQAGHTVTLPDGRRHIFSHFGSGTLAGAATYLSRFFVCNPLLYGREWRMLQAINVTPLVFVDPRAPVTTPYDMMINQMVEEARGASRHGSCGVGFGETIERTEKSPYSLCVCDLKNTSHVSKLLRDIRQHWVPARVQKLGITTITPNWQRRLVSDEILELFLTAATEMLETAELGTENLITATRHTIFEGAQGLLLDQDYGVFPYVTRSNTGLKNCALLARETGITHLDITYATRTYLTRHGAGPLPGELPLPPYAAIEDRTNRPNPYQGTLRFAWLDTDFLKRSIREDLQHGQGLSLSYQLGMSCLDQVDPKIGYISNGMTRRTDMEEFLDRTFARIGTQDGILSFGPMRTTIEDRITSRSTSPQLCRA